MFANSVHTQSLLLAAPAFAVFLAFCWRVVKAQWSSWGEIFLILIVLVFPVSCLGIGYLLELSIVWSVIYICCALVALGTMLVATISGGLFAQDPPYIFLAATCACLIFFIVSVPVAVIPTFKTPLPQPEQIQFDPVTVARSAKAMADKFASFEQALLAEQEKISQSFGNLLTEVENQNIKVEELQRRKSELENKVVKYQQLLSLSEDQVRSVESLLKEGRHIDYIIGFLLGLASSVMVALSGFTFRRLSKQKMLP